MIDNTGIRQDIQRIMTDVQQVMYGIDDVIRLCLTALYTNGHILLEGNPGMGKTELVKTLSKVLHFPYGRIQFTPDLMPADITGTFMPDIKSEGMSLRFQPGPVFTVLLLADEINRATPKTQAAMLEAMAERQVTVLGNQYKLADHNFRSGNGAVPNQHGKPRPFMVLATQNPIDHEGTYDLPEAQSDRFMFKVLMPVIMEDTLERILRKTTGKVHPDDPLLETASAASMSTEQRRQSESFEQQAQMGAIDRYHRNHDLIKQVPLGPDVRTHINNLYLATNRQFDRLVNLEDRQRRELKELMSFVEFGLGPRAAQALAFGAKAWSLLFINDVQEAQVTALAQVVLPVLRHRVKLNYEWYEQQDNELRTGERDRMIDVFLQHLCVACAPKRRAADRDYVTAFEGMLQKLLSDKLF